jgi:hypothetical protein
MGLRASSQVVWLVLEADSNELLSSGEAEVVKVGKGREEEDDGGNLTSKEHRVNLSQYAAYQTRA